MHVDQENVDTTQKKATLPLILLELLNTGT